MSLRILLAASAPDLREELELLLAGSGYDAICASDADAASDLVVQLEPDVCLWALPGPDARARMAELARRIPDAYWVGAGAPRADGAAPPDAPDAADGGCDGGALAPGFDDWLDDPRSASALARVLQRAARACAARRAHRLLLRELHESIDVRPIVGASPAMIELLEALENAAGYPAHVLLQGEQGTGKEGLARAIHAQSARRRGPFVRAVARAEHVVDALFGSVAERAAAPARLLDACGGVLYLEDVDALPAEGQRRLLAALRSEQITSPDGGKPRRIDVRVIAATTRDLRALAGAGEFDGELFARLAGIELRVPPLRERSGDIPLLIDHFVTTSGRRFGKPLRGLTDEALARLVEYRWPGNIRELELVIERAVLLARGEQLALRDLPESLEPDADSARDLALRRGRKRLEADLIRRALQRTGGNRTRAARLLEISHRALLYKLKEHGIRER